MDFCGTSRFVLLDLVIDIVVMDPSHEIFLKACQLAKALLFEGNEEVRQMCMNATIASMSVGANVLLPSIAGKETGRKVLPSLCAEASNSSEPP